MGAGNNRQMKAYVGPDVFFNVSFVYSLLEHIVCGFDVVDLVLGGPLGTQPRGQGLLKRAHVIEVFDLGAGPLPHAGPESGCVDDQPVSLEHAQRQHHGIRAHIEFFRQHAMHQPRAWGKAAIQNALFDLSVGHLFGTQ